ncbi:hypothetical protein M422DRAFT_782597 [Sphaerobolus stellatus SS14]|uniref:Uncharacterized protein n=1 Tax=Sphaerobolus stellatus (strain SS14) TaxID=990650 RepID=A0A0C9TXY9_SPHS4|nr:hypothetical protein M422DRAFT_782597 [Sphaerobolus stellatus SS14]
MAIDGYSCCKGMVEPSRRSTRGWLWNPPSPITRYESPWWRWQQLRYYRRHNIWGIVDSGMGSCGNNGGVECIGWKCDGTSSDIELALEGIDNWTLRRNETIMQQETTSISQPSPPRLLCQKSVKGVANVLDDGVRRRVLKVFGYTAYELD